MSVCEGCGKALTEAYQCPLCQAEGKAEAGLYCGQSCFAEHWLAHRNTCHKRGVVRAKAATKKDSEEKSEEEKQQTVTGKTRKRAREAYDTAAAAAKGEDEDTSKKKEEEEAVSTHYMPWLPLPSRQVCTTREAEAGAAALITLVPALPLDCTHAVVAVPQVVNKEDEQGKSHEVLRHTFWPAAMAAADYVVRCMQAEASATRGTTGDGLRVLVVAADEQSAGGFAWAARCGGLTQYTSLYLAVSRESNITKTSSAAAGSSSSDDTAAASVLFTPARRLVIVTAAVLRDLSEALAQHNDGGDAAAAEVREGVYDAGVASLLMPQTAAPTAALLITLPGVHDVALSDTTTTTTAKTKKIRHVAFVASKQRSKEGQTAGWYTDLAKITHTLKVADKSNNNTTTTTTTATTAAVVSAAPLRKKKGKAHKGKEGTHAEQTTTTIAADVSAALPPWQPLPLKWTTVAVYHTVSTGSKQTHEEVCEEEGDEEEESTLYRRLITYPRLDNDVLSDLVMGEVSSALQRLVQIHAARPGEAEDVIRNCLLCSWGAMSVAHAHHRLAYVLRYLVDHSVHGSSVVKGTHSLSEVALRALVPLCRALPPLTTEIQTTQTSPTANTTPSASELRRYFNYYNATVPNVQLQATLCHVHDAASTALLDALAQAWGITLGIPGYDALQEQHKRRERLVHHVVSRYGTRLGSRYARFLVLLMHFVYDTVGPYSLSVAELERRLLWNVTLAHDVGPLRGFLVHCGLLSDEAADKASEASMAERTRTVQGLSSRLTGRKVQNANTNKKKTNDASRREEEVKLAGTRQYSALPWQTFPRSAQRAQTVDRLRRAALEELLMAMPRQARPMYIGDVGNLIGKWSAFNAKYDGVLGVSLSAFLHSAPETFQVVGTLVTRRRSGAGPQLRIRYDAEDYHQEQDDSEEDGEQQQQHCYGQGNDEAERRREKARDRALLTGLNSKSKNKYKKDKSDGLPARARKKRARKELNRARFNRNYKAVDPSARVPGYVKHAPRRVKGRGHKPNKRIVKRGNN